MTMIKNIRTSEHVSQKKYHDNMWEQFSEWVFYGCRTNTPNRISFADYRLIVSLKNDSNSRYILPGQKYERQFNQNDGDTYEFKSKLVFIELDRKYRFAEWE